MKLTVIEPLGIAKEKLIYIADEILGARADVTIYDTVAKSEEELIERCKDSDIVILANQRFDGSLIEKLPNLKMLNLAFTGTDHVALDVCRKRGILVSNCAGYSTAAVADLVFGMLIGLYRNIIPCEKSVRAGGVRVNMPSHELCGKRFGVVGMGAIGSRVAILARAFGCEVMACTRREYICPGVRFVPLDTIIRQCDIISLHLPLKKDTIGLINEERIAAMKPTAVLINTARGPIVDNDALAKALSEGRIAGAAIDVFDMEPPIPEDYPLLHAPNTILAPHIGFSTDESLERRAVMVMQNALKWLDGSPQNVV